MRMMRLSPCARRQVLLRDEGFAEHQAEGFEQRGEVAVVLLEMEDAGAAIAVERLDDDVAHLLAEGADFGGVACDSVAGIRSGNSVTKIFSGELRTQADR